MTHRCDGGMTWSEGDDGRREHPCPACEEEREHDEGVDRALTLARRYGARVHRSGGRWACHLRAVDELGVGPTPGDAILSALQRAGVAP